MNTPVFTIESNVAIPARVLQNAGPRDSMYPIDDLKPGQAFAIPLTVAEGEDVTKKARQKQSQMSSLARTRKISLVTRFFDGSVGNESPFAGVAAPCLGVWHGGPATEKKPRKAKGEAVEPSTAPAAPEAPAAPAAPAAPDTIEL